MKRLLVLAYGLGCYSMFLGVFLYAIGFIGGFLTPTQMDAAAISEDVPSLMTAALINFLLISGFAVQHSLMARPAFKRWLCRRIPVPIERSTYVLATNILLILMFWQWRPLGGVIWNVESVPARALLWGLFAAGWLTVLITTCLINHFDLFGLRQTWLYFSGRPYTPVPFSTPWPYRIVRHPLYVGWMLAFWATPNMTLSHLLFAVSLTGYILFAIRLEERDLMNVHDAYAAYRRTVPMLIPRWKILKALSGDLTPHLLDTRMEPEHSVQ